MGDSNRQIKPDPPPCHFNIPACQTHVWCLNAKKAPQRNVEKKYCVFRVREVGGG